MFDLKVQVSHASHLTQKSSHIGETIHMYNVETDMDFVP